MKIKCVKTEKCPIFGNKGSIQVFFNKQNKIKYARVRHYSGLNEAKKPQFDYCKIKELNHLETMLTSLNFQFPQAQQKQLGHKVTKDFHDHTSVSLLSGQPDSSLKLKVAGPLGLAPKRGQVQLDETHQCLPKLGFMCSNPTPAPKLGHLTSLFCHHNITNLN
jgi:hypothetical protein